MPEVGPAGVRSKDVIEVGTFQSLDLSTLWLAYGALGVADSRRKQATSSVPTPTRQELLGKTLRAGFDNAVSVRRPRAAFRAVQLPSLYR